MISSGLGLAIELLVTGLLAVTIGYCAMLNRRLKSLRADEAALKEMVLGLVQAGETAERTLAEFRETAAGCERELDARLADAKHFGRFLSREVERGEVVLERLARISEATRVRRRDGKHGADTATENLVA